MNHSNHTRLIQLLVAGCLTALLTACGGGGGSTAATTGGGGGGGGTTEIQGIEAPSNVSVVTAKNVADVQ